MHDTITVCLTYLVINFDWCQKRQLDWIYPLKKLLFHIPLKDIGVGIIIILLTIKHITIHNKSRDIKESIKDDRDVCRYVKDHQ